MVDIYWAANLTGKYPPLVIVGSGESGVLTNTLSCLHLEIQTFQFPSTPAPSSAENSPGNEFF